MVSAQSIKKKAKWKGKNYIKPILTVKKNFLFFTMYEWWGLNFSEQLWQDWYRGKDSMCM